MPLGFTTDNSGRVFVVASKGGAPQHPAWFRNLRANPSVTVELGDRSFPATAVEAVGAERDRLYALASSANPAYGEYEQNATRVFPVVVLEGVPAPA